MPTADKITGHRATFIVFDDPIPDWSDFPVLQPEQVFDYSRLPPRDEENIGLFDLKNLLVDAGVDPTMADQMLSKGRLTADEVRQCIDDGDQDTRL